MVLGKEGERTKRRVGGVGTKKKNTYERKERKRREVITKKKDIRPKRKAERKDCTEFCFVYSNLLSA